MAVFVLLQPLQKLGLLEAVGGIAEAAIGLQRAAVAVGLLLVQHLRNLDTANAADGGKHPLTRAIAPVLHLKLVKNIERDVPHGDPRDLLKGHPLAEAA